MSLKYYPTQIHYCVPLSKRKWDCLNKINDRGDEREDVAPSLVKAGAIERTVEYNGHFGRYIFFATEKERQAKRVVADIERLLA